VPKPITEEVLFRFLLAKYLLEKNRNQSVADGDNFFIAQQVLTAHDAADLAIGAVANHLDTGGKAYLKDNVLAVEEKLNHPILGSDFIRLLNDARNSLKHRGVMPNKNQFSHAVDKTYDYLANWCESILELPFVDLDQSYLLHDDEVRSRYKAAKTLADDHQYERALIILGEALHIVLRENSALRGLQSGIATSEDAIKLAGFGVHANDYLALQEFLPRIYVDDETKGLKHYWKQQKFGHPANWRAVTVEFCLRVFLETAIKIQSAEWIPGPIAFIHIYDLKVTALEDVEIWKDRPAEGEPSESVGKLDKGKSILASKVVKLFATPEHGRTLAGLLAGYSVQGDSFKKYKEHLEIVCLNHDEEWFHGFVAPELLQ
jgi:hypothetical protein